MTILGLIIDVLIVGTLVVLGIIGFKKGFLKSVLSLLSWSVCLIVAVLIAKYVAGWINHIYNFSSLIGSRIEAGLIGSNEFYAKAVNSYAEAEKPVEALLADIPSGTNKLLAQLIKVVFTSSNVDMTSEASIANVVGLSLGQISMVIISAILVFAILMIVVKLLGKFFDKLTKLKIIGAVNKVLGVVFGLVKAGIIIIVLNCLLVALSLVPVVNKGITPLIQDNTYIEKVIYNKTDEIIGKKVIEGEMLQKWVADMWNSR